MPCPEPSLRAKPLLPPRTNHDRLVLACTSSNEALWFNLTGPVLMVSPGAWSTGTQRPTTRPTRALGNVVLGDWLFAMPAN
jgi:hypothetical protein